MRKALQILVTFSVLVLIIGNVNAQRACASHEHYLQMAASDPQFVINQQKLEEATRRFIEAGGAASVPITMAEGVVYRIPVVFHVVYNSSQPETNISDARILAQLKVLNEDFQKLNADWVNTPAVYQGRVADVQIQFCLPERDPNGNPTSGIIRKSTTVSSFGTNDAVKNNSQGGSNAWPRDQYLNFWVCNLSSSLLGYAQFPGGNASTDGVVCDYATVGGPDAPGEYANYGIGRTATHEIGHWLNLRHIWGDIRCGNDAVDDTPVHPSSNGGCPASDLTTNCTANRGDLMMWMNYMDYTYDRCMYMFTNGQKDRMWAVLEPGGFRAAITSSPAGCQSSSGTPCAVPSGLSSTNITQTGATLSWNTVSGATGYTVQHRTLAGPGPWVEVSSASNSKTLSALNASTTYEWQVRTECGSNSSNYSSSAQFTTSAVTGGCTDNYEPNNTSGTPSPIPVSQTISAKICSTTDVDWYTFSNNNQNRAVRVTLTVPNGVVYNMRLYRPNGQLAGATNNTNSIKFLSFSGNPTGAYRVEVFSTTGSSETESYTLLAEIGSSFREADAGRLMISGNEIITYPNPAASELILQFGTEWQGTKAEVVMTDISGRQVQRELVNASGNVMLDVRKLHTGLYLMRVSNGRLNQVEKIMIRK